MAQARRAPSLAKHPAIPGLLPATAGNGGTGVEFQEVRSSLRRSLAATVALSALVAPAALAKPDETSPNPLAAREVEPVVLIGAQLPSWSRAAAVAAPTPYGDGSLNETRSAHNGTVVVPPDARTGVPVDEIVGYRWDARKGRYREIPFQVDERFPYLLANGRSDFGVYSATDEELTYAWDLERWNMTAGQCSVEHPAGEGTMADPAEGLDDDDELVFMADDAGAEAPATAGLPPGVKNPDRQVVRVDDPTDPGNPRFVYLFRKDKGSGIDPDDWYVRYERDANADQWIDRRSFADDDPEKLGSSNTGYGPNIPGTVCDPDGTIRNSTDRFPRDGVTVTTDTYRWRATGRWMVREIQITKPGEEREYGPDLIDRWKGRAFQQAPDSQISVVGFEDEQVNWEGNSALLGELVGPVRAIRETWGADSGTNVTKTETFYRNAVQYRYRVRVHPIPPDGLYTSWDYNQNVAQTYYNEHLHADQSDPTATTVDGGVPIDGRNDEIVGNVDGVEDFPAYFDAPDPTHTKPLSFFNWEQVSGKDDNGSLVYMFEMKNAQSLENPLVVPYYRDDACLDDGTGDDPSPRPWPGETQDRAYPEGTPCYTEAPEGYEGPYRQGCFGCHGIHYFVTQDTDNATFTGGGVNEIDGAQWQWAVPTAQPTNIGDRYANTVKTPLVPIAVAQASTPQDGGGDPEPLATTIEITGDMSGQATDTATLAARLGDANGPVAGEEIRFSLGGEPVGSAVTDESGTASIQVTLDGPARETEQTAAFAGDEDHAASSATAPFQISLEDSSMTLTLTRSGPSYEARATLTETDTGSPLSGREITFTLNGRPVGTATTDDQGVATITIPRSQGKKANVVEASFGGDGTYGGAAASQRIN